MKRAKQGQASPERLNDRTTRFDLAMTGEVYVTDKATPVPDYRGDTIGFRLPDGAVARPVIAFEIEKNDAYHDHSSAAALAALGLFIEDFSRVFTAEEGAPRRRSPHARPQDDGPRDLKRPKKPACKSKQ